MVVRIIVQGLGRDSAEDDILDLDIFLVVGLINVVNFAGIIVGEVLGVCPRAWICADGMDRFIKINGE